MTFVVTPDSTVGAPPARRAGHLAAEPDPHDPLAGTEAWARPYELERTEGVSAMRGLVFGLIFAAPVWALIIGGVVALINLGS